MIKMKYFYLKEPTKIVESGNYRVVRLMPRNRILLEVQPSQFYRRQLTIVPLAKGKFV